jgi:hypothetical protein
VTTGPRDWENNTRSLPEPRKPDKAHRAAAGVVAIDEIVVGDRHRRDRMRERP